MFQDWLSGQGNIRSFQRIPRCCQPGQWLLTDQRKARSHVSISTFLANRIIPTGQYILELHQQEKLQSVLHNSYCVSRIISKVSKHLKNNYLKTNSNILTIYSKLIFSHRLFQNPSSLKESGIWTVPIHFYSQLTISK